MAPILHVGPNHVLLGHYHHLAGPIQMGKTVHTLTPRCRAPTRMSPYSCLMTKDEYAPTVDLSSRQAPKRLPRLWLSRKEKICQCQRIRHSPCRKEKVHHMATFQTGIALTANSRHTGRQFGVALVTDQYWL